MAILGYGVLLLLTFTNMSNVYLLFIPGFLIFSTNGIMSILTTVFLANSVDYGELKNNRRDESVIFSMQTFVVKLASGLAVFIASVYLEFNQLDRSTEISEADKLVDWSLNVAQSAKTGLRMTMTMIPIIGLTIAFFWFRRKYTLTDAKVEEIAAQVKEKRAAEESK